MAYGYQNPHPHRRPHRPDLTRRQPILPLKNHANRTPDIVHEYPVIAQILHGAGVELWHRNVCQNMFILGLFYQNTRII